MLENPDLDSLDSSDEMSDLSEFSGMSSSIELIENSSEKEQVDSIYFSKKQLMTRKKQTVKSQLEQLSETSSMVEERGAQLEMVKKGKEVIKRKTSMAMKKR